VSSIESNVFLTFSLSSQLYGIEFTRVKEILTFKGATAVPDSKPWVKGVIDLRDCATPLIDLRIRFGLEKEPIYDEKTVIIAVKIGNGKFIAYVVDAVDTIETTRFNEIMPPNSSGVIDPEFLKGYFKTDSGKMTIILDVEKILAAEEMNKLVQL
jgi:purine-binding chemotaxis protein CheW